MYICIYIILYIYVKIKKSGGTILFLYSTLALIYTSYSATVNFKLLHKNFVSYTHQYCSSPPPKSSKEFHLSWLWLCLYPPCRCCTLPFNGISLLPRALYFSYHNPCYSWVLTPPSRAWGVSSPLPPDVLFGCRQGAGAPSLEQRSCGRTGDPALTPFARSALCCSFTPWARPLALVPLAGCGQLSPAAFSFVCFPSSCLCQLRGLCSSRDCLRMRCLGWGK